MRPGLELFRVLYGSHAHGTNTPASDEDWRGVYLLPTRDLVGLGRPATTWEGKRDDGLEDEVYWELAHFCNLLLKGNPNIVGMLYAPDDVVKNVHPAFSPICENRHLMLHRGTMQAYMGWVEREIRDLRQIPPEIPRFKRLSHVPRLIWEIASVIDTGELKVRPDGWQRNKIMAIKTGQIPWAEALDWAETYARELRDAIGSHPWPEPPREWLEDYLLNAREDYGGSLT